MPYTLPPLPYPADALEPHIDAQTMEIHHGKHHNAYVTNLNKALEGTDLDNQPIEELIARSTTVPENIRTAVRNNGGGHANHSLFWTIMGPRAAASPTGTLADAITSELGSFDKFKEEFAKAATTRFGSGWAWLIARQERQARRRKHAQPGQPADGRQHADPRPRRLGARLLPEVPEPPPRLHRRLVERRQLGRRRTTLPASEEVVPGCAARLGTRQYCNAAERHLSAEITTVLPRSRSDVRTI